MVPRARIGQLLEQVAHLGERREVITLTYGHAGDGNLHVNFLWNEPRRSCRASSAPSKTLFRATVELGGTLSGEHGIGIVKAPYLPLEQPEELIHLQRDLKRSSTPKASSTPARSSRAAATAPAKSYRIWRVWSQPVTSPHGAPRSRGAKRRAR